MAALSRLRLQADMRRMLVAVTRLAQSEINKN
jgi:hypothetical protein